MRHSIQFLGGLAGPLLAAACAGGTAAPDHPPQIAVASVSVSHDVWSLAAGTSKQFLATPRDAQGNALPGRAVTWSSSADGVASVQVGGMVSAVATSARVFGVSAGLAQIRATSEGMTGTVMVTVTPPVPVATVSLSTTSATLVPNQTLALTAIPLDAQSNPLPGRVVDWSTSANGIATVGTGGLVTAVAVGTATITATSEGKTAQATITVQMAGSVVELAVGEFHTCGRTTSNAVYCWGDNSVGQLGDGTIATRSTPTPVSGGFAFVEVKAGLGHTCGRTTTDAAYCWGANFKGLLGDGTTVNQYTPTPVSGGLAFVELAAGGFYTCGRTASNAAYCWGDNGIGQLGLKNGPFTVITTPTSVTGNLSFVELAAGGAHTCGRTTSNDAFCWGDNFEGQLGNGATPVRQYDPAPEPVIGDLSFVELAAGGHHTCGRTTSNAVYCWGSNSYGQLGDGTTVNRYIPTPVSRGLDFVQLTAGGQHTCGRTTENAAYCWGNNIEGQLGDGTSGVMAGRSTPTLVSGGLAFVQLTTGGYRRTGEPAGSHTCGRTTSNAVFCWGNNDHGQLGDGTRQNRAAPVRVLWP